ncbi:MAG: NAD-dependent epimerase/dehydratase family protein [Methanobacteriota archaeon]
MSRGAASDHSVLVVGGAGFVGSNLVRRLLAEGCRRVVVVDNLLSAERDNVPSDPRIDFVEGSIADESVLARVADEFDLAFHLATYHGNQSSIADPLADHANNLETTLRLYERLKSFRALKRVVYASTGCALAARGEGPAVPVVEDGPIPLDFDSPYQISKVVGEMYSVYYHQRHGLPVVRARFQNVYGPGEVLGAGRWRGTPHTVWRNVVPVFIYRAVKGKALQVHGAGDATRDFIFVEDLVDGLWRMATAPGVEGDVFNLASGRETAVRDLAALVNKYAANDAPVERLPPRDWDRSIHRVGSTEKSRRRLGFSARTSLEDGLLRTVEWTRANLPRIERCIARHAKAHGIEV